MFGGIGNIMDKVEGAVEGAVGGGGGGALDKVVEMLKKADGEIDTVISGFKDKCEPKKVFNIKLPRIPVDPATCGCPSPGEIVGKFMKKVGLVVVPLVAVVAACFAKTFATPMPELPSAPSQADAAAWAKAYETASYQWLINLTPILMHLIGVFLMWKGTAAVWLDDVGDDVVELRGITDAKRGEVKGHVDKIAGVFDDAKSPIQDFMSKLESEFKPAQDVASKIESLTGEDIPSPDDIISKATSKISSCTGNIEKGVEAVLAKLEEFMPKQLHPTDFFFNKFVPAEWVAVTPMKVMFCHIPLFILLCVQMTVAMLSHIGAGPWSNPYEDQLDAAKAGSSSATVRAVGLATSHGWTVAVAAFAALAAVTMIGAAAGAVMSNHGSVSDEEQPLLAGRPRRTRSQKPLMMAAAVSVGVFCVASTGLVSAHEASGVARESVEGQALDRWGIMKTETLRTIVPTVVALCVNVSLFWVTAFLTMKGNLLKWANRAVIGMFETNINKCLDGELKEFAVDLYNWVTKNLKGEWKEFKDKALPPLEKAAKIPGL